MRPQLQRPIHRPLALTLTALLAFACLAAAPRPQPVPNPNPKPEATVVYVVRHAEKAADSGRDPELSPAGAARAERLAAMLADASIAAVFVTPTTRSRDTGSPVAQGADVQLTPYNPFDNDELVRLIRDRHAGDAVLVVAHSNTVAPIVHALGGPKDADLAEDEYTRLYAIILNDTGAARTLRLRF